MARAFKWYAHFTRGSSLLSGAQNKVDLLAQIFDSNIKGLTVTRTILKVISKPTAIDTETDLHFGIAVVGSDAFTADALPDADVESDNVRWLLRGYHVDVINDLNDRSQWSESNYDLKAQVLMRSEQDRYTFIVDNFGTGDLTWWCICRTLCRLP